jgi:hypothetical protein
MHRGDKDVVAGGMVQSLGGGWRSRRRGPESLGFAQLKNATGGVVQARKRNYKDGIRIRDARKRTVVDEGES